MDSFSSWLPKRDSSALFSTFPRFRQRPSSEERVRKGAEKLTKFLNSKQQGRLDGFFTVKPKEKKSPTKADAKGKGKDAAKGTKRKVGLLFFLHLYQN
jgi:hypothetical protein